MASKRMFSSVVVGDDNFRLMSAEAQLLYFTFGMEADDYGKKTGNPRFPGCLPETG